MTFMSNYTAPERLNPRDSLFGGRTNALKLYHKTAEDKRVSYLDFTSLYPFVQSRKTYPIGHPEIIKISNDRVVLGLLNAQCNRNTVGIAMKKDPFQGFGHLWSSRTLSLKGIQLSKLWKSGTFRIRQTRCSGIM